MKSIESVKQKILDGGEITSAEALWLAEVPDKEELYQAAREITRHFGKPAFNPCSIINVRAGQYSENCKWCAQSGYYYTDSEVHGILSAGQVLSLARHDESKGVKRFCQVTSGRAVKGAALRKICDNYRELRKSTNLFLCGFWAC